MNRYNKVIVCHGLLTLCVVICIIWAAVFVHRYYTKPLLAEQADSQIIYIEPGSRLRQISQQLHAQGVIESAKIFEWLVRLQYPSESIKAGEYAIQPGDSFMHMMDQLVHGKVMLRRITFVEGIRYDDMIAQLNQVALSGSVSHQRIADIVHPVFQSSAHYEGLFFPDTYYVSRTDDRLSILKQSHDRLVEVLLQAWENRQPGLPYQSMYEALIAASLIEKESRLDIDRALISSVIVNRLNKHMYLAIDASVLYGLNSGLRRVLYRDLLSQTPYNTYRIKVLPPTPICMPSKASIEAALHPQQSPYLFYVATGNGGHYFSQSFAQHKRAIEQVQSNKWE